MSRATTIIIHADPQDASTVADLSAWLAGNAARTDSRTTDRAGHLVPMYDSLAADAWGGYKTPDPGLWGGVANHLDPHGFAGHAATLDWQHPQRVQILLKDEGDPWFRLYMIRDGQLTQHAPTPNPDDTELAW